MLEELLKVLVAIVNALNANTQALNAQATGPHTIAEATPTAPVAPAAPVDDVPAITEPPAAPTPEPPAAPTPEPAAPVAMTKDELNVLLLEEYKRLGSSRAPIDEVLRNHNVVGVNDLAETQYAEVLAAVKAIPTPAAQA